VSAHALVTSPPFTGPMPRSAVTCPPGTLISSLLAASA
jgi:hypothetical protein